MINNYVKLFSRMKMGFQKGWLVEGRMVGSVAAGGELDQLL